MPIQDENGQLVSDPAQIVQKLLMGLRNYQAGGAIVVPVGKMGLEEANSNGDAYLKAYELCNEEITLAILGANLSTQGGKYGTQALGEVHQDTVGHMVSHGKAWYIQTVTEQIIKPLVLYNYGEEGLQVLPRISIGETEQQDFPATAGAIASLLATPILTPHVFNKLLEMLHLPLLPDDVITTLIGKWDAETAAAVTMAENPMGAPGQDPNAEGGEPQPGDGEGAPQDPTSEAANERNYY